MGLVQSNSSNKSIGDTFSRELRKNLSSPRNTSSDSGNSNYQYITKNSSKINNPPAPKKKSK